MTQGYGENTRDFLLTEETSTTKKLPKCLTVKLTLQGITVNALVDTGSEITAISEQLFNDHQGVLNRCPSLPLAGITVHGATGGRPVKVNRQIFTEINLEGIIENATLFIIPKLTSDLIVGVDFLRKIKTKIDL